MHHIAPLYLMRTAITIGYTEDGKTRLLAGPDTPADEQRESFAAAIEGKMPKDCVRVELWMSDRGRAKKALCPKYEATLAKEAAEAARAQKAKEAEAAKPARKPAGKKAEQPTGAQTNPDAPKPS